MSSKPGFKGKKGNPKRDKSFKAKSQSSSGYNAYKSGRSNKREYKFSPLDSRYSAPQATYVTVLEQLENEVLKTFEKGAKDVAQSLVDLKRCDPEKPKLQRSQVTDPGEKERENAEFEFEYKDHIKRYNYRVDDLDNGLTKACALIWSDYMTVSMIDRIEQHPDFASKIKGNAIELLKAIKASMHETTRSQKPVLSAIQAITKLFTYKQGDMSGLSDYLKCFKEHRDVFKTQMLSLIHI
jgi:hypothetical protein